MVEHVRSTVGRIEIDTNKRTIVLTARGDSAIEVAEELLRQAEEHSP